MTPIEKCIADSREREAKAKAAGCLPADSCVFDGANGRCIFCNRLSGDSPGSAYEEKWGAKDAALADLPRFRDAVEVALKQIRLEAPTELPTACEEEIERILTEGK